MADIRIENHGTIFLFHMLTPTATEWVDNNVGGTTLYLGNALAVEPRCVEALAAGMIENGLEVDVR